MQKQPQPNTQLDFPTEENKVEEPKIPFLEAQCN